ncbi:MAG: FMN-binding protein [Desulfobacteraceae bacterium]|nr:MAG: FMN-binding protein [Desulfobacteraceae bacterium]
MTTSSSTISEKSERFQNSYLLQAWLVIGLALFFGIALTGIQIALSSRIETNKKKETMEKVPEIILGANHAQNQAATDKSLKIEQRSITVDKNNRKKVYTVFETRYPDGKPAGWVAKASGQGYADKIELLFGVDPGATKLTGLFILEQKETPGLGNKITDQHWRDQFILKPTGRMLKVVKGGAKGPYEIDAITGATISSKSVTTIINKTLADIQKQLASLAANPKEDNQ